MVNTKLNSYARHLQSAQQSIEQSSGYQSAKLHWDKLAEATLKHDAELKGTKPKPFSATQKDERNKVMAKHLGLSYGQFFTMAKCANQRVIAHSKRDAVSLSPLLCSDKFRILLDNAYDTLGEWVKEREARGLTLNGKS